MPYYHVLAKLKSEDDFRCLYSDLSTDELKKKFIRSYEDGTTFFSSNKLISPLDLRFIQIIQTQRLDAIEREEISQISLAKIDEINRSSSGVFFLSVGRGYDPEDISEAGEDVTHNFIKGPPGVKSNRWVLSMKMFHWLAGIIAVVLSAGAIKWLGWI